MSEGERECETYRERLKFFNWKIEFPEVFPEIDRPDDPANGFHLILGNPPWDKTKFEEPLFFAQHHSNYRTLPNSQKRKIAHDLLARPAIKQRYEREKETIELANAYLQAKFPLSRGAGDNNLFRFFVERALGLLAPRGGLSYLAPTGLLTEAGSFKLRKNILENFRLKSFDGFENRNRLFPAVDSRYKFGLIQLEKVRDPDQVAQTRFRLTDPADLATNEGCFPYSLAEIKATSPKHLAYLETSGGELGLKILLKLYKKFPPLEPTWLDFRNELHATKDKKLFHESNNPGFIPLYKGEMIGQYQAFKAPPKYWLDPAEFDNYLLSSRLKTLKNDLKAQYAWDEGFAKAFPEGFQWPRILAFLEASSDQDLARFLVPERSLWRLAFRAIARDTDERTLIAALVPQNRGAQNSLWISIPGRYALDLSQRKIVYQRVSLARLLFAQALFNSLVVDWILRASMAMNVNKTYFQRLPLPQPDDERLLADPTYLDLVKDSAFLSLCQGRELWADLKRAIAFDDSEIPPSPLIFDRRQAGLDFKIATLYGLTPEELEIILDGFKVLRAKRSNYCSLIIDLINNKSLP
ncbi:MAG: hypothetical protein LBR11_09430 [Deltaproteobacteria bacterium]|nr:hypothetical protein [Deltaproteobacteria bacterium]